MRERKIREGEITREDEERKGGGESKTAEVEVVEGKRVVLGSRTALEDGRRGGGRRRLPMEDQVDQKVWFQSRRAFNQKNFHTYINCFQLQLIMRTPDRKVCQSSTR